MEIREANLYFGDLYCKNCFTRLFKTKGKFDDVFGGKSLPKNRTSVANAGESGAAVGPDGLPLSPQTVAETQIADPAAQPQDATYAQPAEVAAVEQPAAEQPVAEQPAAEQPAAEQPVAEQPAAEQPAAEQPAAEPVAEAVAGDAPVAVDGPVEAAATEVQS